MKGPKTRNSTLVMSLVAIAVLGLLAGSVRAQLNVIVTETGRISLSVGANGNNDGTGTIDFMKPAGASVRRVIVLAASTGGTGFIIPDGEVTVDVGGGPVPISWDLRGSTSVADSVYADATAELKPALDAAFSGNNSATITEANTRNVDGVILAIVWDDPSQTSDKTVVFLFGGQDPQGDRFFITLAEPLDFSAEPLADMGLGISFGCQVPGNCGFAVQISLIDVNATRMTSSAGGQDDGQTEDGALITVGGFGDTNANPPANDPPSSFRTDDELYSLLPFVASGDTQIQVDTINPSNDDNIFFGYFVTSVAAIVGEGILLTPAQAENRVGQRHTVTASIRDDNGIAIPNRQVDFEIVSGPQAGLMGSDVSDVNGNATLTYTGTMEGTDVIVARMISSSGNLVRSNEVTKTWVATCTHIVTFDNDVDGNVIPPGTDISGITFENQGVRLSGASGDTGNPGVFTNVQGAPGSDTDDLPPVSSPNIVTTLAIPGDLGSSDFGTICVDFVDPDSRVPRTAEYVEIWFIDVEDSTGILTAYSGQGCTGNLMFESRTSDNGNSSQVRVSVGGFGSGAAIASVQISFGDESDSAALDSLCFEFTSSFAELICPIPRTNPVDVSPGDSFTVPMRALNFASSRFYGYLAVYFDMWPNVPHRHRIMVVSSDNISIRPHGDVRKSLTYSLPERAAMLLIGRQVVLGHLLCDSEEYVIDCEPITIRIVP